jgi:hypothetical protein
MSEARVRVELKAPIENSQVADFWLRDKIPKFLKAAGIFTPT